MTRKTNKPIGREKRSISEMTAEQQAAEAARLLALPDDAWRPLSARQRALHVAARKRGRPPKLPEDRRVKAMVAFDPKLIVELDSHATAIGSTRSGLIEQAVRTLLAASTDVATRGATRRVR